MLRPGAVLQGKYVVDRVLGSGGSAVVYLARQALLGDRPVAVKELTVQAGDTEGRASAVARFRGEAEILSALDHPGLVEVSDFFEEAGHPYLVMAYVEGHTLQDICENADGFLDGAVVAAWADQICEVLAWLHARRPPVIYRDLKPTNVMLDNAGRIRLLDFGIARVLEDDARTGTLVRGCGTPGFAPVEQMGEGTTDARSDIYALGATMYALLTRRVPPLSLDLLAGNATLARPREINPALSPGLEDLILKMVALRKEHRFHDVDDVRLALDDVKKGRWGSRSRSTAGAGLAEGAPALRLKRVSLPGVEGGGAPAGSGAESQPVQASPRRRVTSPLPGASRGEGPPPPSPPPASGVEHAPPVVLLPGAESGASSQDAWNLLKGEEEPLAVTGASLHDSGFGFAGTGVNVAGERVPSWARHMQEEPEDEAPPPAPGLLYDRFWRWYLYAAIMVLAVALVLPVFLAPRGLGPMALPNALLYNLGRAFGAATGWESLRYPSGFLAQLLPAVILAVVFYCREDFFAAIAFGLWACESLFEAGVCMRTNVGLGLHWTMAQDLRHVFPALAAEDFMKLGRAVHLLAMFGMGASLYGMGRWLYRYRPTRLLMDFYAGRKDSSDGQGADPIALHGIDALREAEARAMRLFDRALRPVVNLGLTWVCVLVCSETGLLRLSLPSVSSDKDINMYLGAAVISVVMFSVSEVVELVYGLLVSLTQGVLFLVFPLYILGAGLVRLKLAEVLLQGWFTHTNSVSGFVVLVLVLGGTRWHLDRIVPRRSEPVDSKET